MTIAICSNGIDVDIRVTDNGAGIHPAETDRIFDRFYRAQAAVDGAVTGSGLGLSIAKGMIEAQNGSIAVASKLGHGSTFTLSLPTVRGESSTLTMPDRPSGAVAVTASAVPAHVLTVTSPSTRVLGFDGR